MMLVDLEIVMMLAFLGTLTCFFDDDLPAQLTMWTLFMQTSPPLVQGDLAQGSVAMANKAFAGDDRYELLNCRLCDCQMSAWCSLGQGDMAGVN